MKTESKSVYTKKCWTSDLLSTGLVLLPLDQRLHQDNNGLTTNTEILITIYNQIKHCRKNQRLSPSDSRDPRIETPKMTEIEFKHQYFQ